MTDRAFVTAHDVLCTRTLQRSCGARAGHARGFTYIELLLALALLSVGLLATLPLTLQGATSNAASRDLTVAATLAADSAETLRAVPLSALTSGNDVVPVAPVRFQRTWVVETNVPQPGLTTVTVTVTGNRTPRVGPAASVTVRFFRAL